ncbi:ATP-dependent metallopeptidase FtsH/Yme1/Tma family protein [bacterium 1XD21-13]|nr:ATP-dependent metallopeptidase FtsH/Yme1/Tma family protein [bacterium 1XD21-13]
MEENNNSNRPGSNGPGNNGGGDNNKSPKNRQSILVVLIVTMLTMLAWNYFTGMGAGSTVITYDEFIEMLDKGEVESVELTSNQIKITAKEKNARGGDIIYTTGIMPDYQLEEKLIEADVIHSAPISDMREMVLSVIINFLLPLAFIWLIFGVVMRKMGGGGMMGMGVGKSKAKVYIEKETGVTFKDVAGEEEAKESLQEVVDFLHNPGKYAEIGAKLPKGALLVGPPGTGKTLLAKAVAGEAHVPFFSLSGSDFVEMFVGVGASRVRDLFSEAKKHSPCIIFIDEIDAIGKSRDSRYGGGNDEREQTLNQLLAEMDGFDSHTACLILGATNRPEVLDPALLRPGRFDRRIIVDRPDLKGRVDILKVHAKNVNMDETVDLDEIALATSGAVGSDLANMINEAAILAVKNKRKAVAQKDLFEAVEVVLVGKEKKDRIMSKEERRIVSYHEVGHALVSALQKDAEPVQKITIVPRTMGALGYVMQVPEEEKYLNTKKEIDAMLVGYLAGRAAEELVFETVTTGASNDIEKATRLARAMVTQYGMSEKFGLMGLETRENEYLTGRTVMNCGDATAAEVDQEVMKILKDSYEEAKRLLSENRDAMDKIAEFLIQKETITGKEFMKLFREAKGIPEPEEEETEKKAETAENPNGTAEKEAQTSQEGVADQESQVSQENAANQESQASQESTANQEAQVIRENTAEQEARTDQEGYISNRWE